MNSIFSEKSLKYGRFIRIPLIVIILAGVLCSCATMTHYPVDIADQSAFSGKWTPDDAVAFIQKETQASSSDADYRSFVLDKNGFSFAKTVKKTKKQTINGVSTDVEYEETQVHHVPWQSVTRIDPYLKGTFIGDLYGVQLQFTSSKVVSALRQNISAELDLYCDNYEELTHVVAALHTLMGR